MDQHYKDTLLERLDTIEQSSDLIRGHGLREIWRNEEVNALGYFGDGRNWAELVDEVYTHVLPPSVVPLSLERQPFLGLAHKTLLNVVACSLLQPERMGRLTDSVRRVLGFQRIVPREFVVAEAHIDATTVDAALVQELTELGFETDNFARIEPAHYKHHFTFQLIMHKSPKHETTRRYREVHSAGEEASRILDRYTTGYSYVETEWYNSNTAKTYEYRPLIPGALRNFPFDGSTFVKRAVPTTQKEVLDSGTDFGRKRAADIHIKIPSHLRHPDYKAIDSDPARDLKSRLIDSGFYEIVSEGGNFIYSAHFADIAESRLAFERLDEFARMHGGLTGVCWEACTRMWRKKVTTESGWFVAGVPPHLSFRDPPVSRATQRRYLLPEKIGTNGKSR